MLQSARLINQLISAEVEAGIDPSRIIIGGFSQGGTISLLTGLTGERKLAGITVLSGWLPLRHKFKAVSAQVLPTLSLIISAYLDGFSAHLVHTYLLGLRYTRSPHQVSDFQRLIRLLDLIPWNYTFDVTRRN